MGNIINNISKGALNTYKYAAESAGKIAREIKLKAQMSSNKAQIKELYEDIGKNVYEKYLLKENIDIDSDFSSDCSMIDVLAGEIEEMRMEILSLKELKQCPKCNYEIELDYHYCPNCGCEQDLTEEDMKNDGPATIETTDNIDKTLKRQDDSNNETKKEAHDENIKDEKGKHLNYKNNLRKENSIEEDNLEQSEENDINKDNFKDDEIENENDIDYEDTEDDE